MGKEERSERGGEWCGGEGGGGRCGGPRPDDRDRGEGRGGDGRGGVRRRPGGRRKGGRVWGEKTPQGGYKDIRRPGSVITEGGKIMPHAAAGQREEHQRQSVGVAKK